MLVSSFVPATFLKSTGKINTFASGSPKWLKILAIANLYIDQWQDEPNVDWNSLRLPTTTTATTLVTATNEFAYDTSTIRKISNQEGDFIRIVHTDGVAFTDYTTIDGTRQKDYANGQRTFQNNWITNTQNKIQFNRAFTSADPQFGGTIYLPAYGYASHITDDSDVIPVDIPNWLVFAVAAEYIRTDVTRQPQYGNIIEEANQIMDVMKQNNSGQSSKLLMPWNPLGPSGTYINTAWYN
jgi:hypothetical protein